MSSSGLARAIPRSHQEREVACGGLNQEFLVHILNASYVQPVQSAGIKLVREVPFDPLSPLPLQPLSAIALNAPPVAVDRCLLRRFAVPVTRATIRLRDIRSHW
jgi:hypothetical protein